MHAGHRPVRGVRAPLHAQVRSRSAARRSSRSPPARTWSRARPRSSPCARSTSRAARRGSRPRSRRALAPGARAQPDRARRGADIDRARRGDPGRRLGLASTGRSRARCTSPSSPSGAVLLVRQGSASWVVSSRGRVMRKVDSAAPRARFRGSGCRRRVHDRASGRRCRATTGKLAAAAVAPIAPGALPRRRAARRLEPDRLTLVLALGPAGQARRHRRPAAEAGDRAPDPRRSPPRTRPRRAPRTSMSASPSARCSAPTTLKSQVQVEV